MLVAFFPSVDSAVEIGAIPQGFSPTRTQTVERSGEIIGHVILTTVQ
jgi:hypothetical protein